MKRKQTGKEKEKNGTCLVQRVTKLYRDTVMTVTKAKSCFYPKSFRISCYFRD